MGWGRGWWVEYVGLGRGRGRGREGGRDVMAWVEFRAIVVFMYVRADIDID